MSMTRWVVGRRRRAGLLAAGVALFASGLTASGLPSGVASGAPAQSAEPAPCPDAFPVEELEPGLEATGLTVERGTTPDEFTATVVGVLEDGIASGVDMIIVEADSPAIQRAGGIWGGMSGSPVYAADGRLIGAVSYTLGAGETPIAGVTPAAAMLALLDRPGAAPPAAEAVELPAPLRERVVATGEASAAEAASGLRQIPVPVGVSGVHPARLDETLDRLGQRIPGAHVHATGAVPTGQPGSGAGSTIVPGGNFATAVSYGDVSVAGVGTTTAVCPGRGGRRVLAFGHPMLQLGATTESLHPATAVHVQDDLFGPFKVANVGGVIGTVDQDRLVGLRGVLGPRPPATDVTSTFSSEDEGTSLSGTTRVNVEQFLTDPVFPIVFQHVLSALDRTADRIGPGSTELRWVVTGTRPSGESFTVDVTNLYADQADVSYVTPADLHSQLDTLRRNRFEDVTITDVELTGSISSEVRQYTVEEVLVRQPDGSYAPVPADGTPIPVTPGGTLDLRVVLTPYQGNGEVTEVDLSLEVPADAPAGFGEARVVGGPDLAAPPGSAARSFDQLVDELEGLTPNNALTATLNLEGVPPTDTPSARELVDQVVTGATSIPVEVVAP